MIAPNDIVFHLRAYLPAFTDLFSDTITGTASTLGNVVRVNSTNHGVTLGDKLIVAGGKLRNAITDRADNSDGTVRLRCPQEHDLTEPQARNDTKTIILGGFNEPEWNGEFSIEAVPNRQFFEVKFPSGVTTLPTGAGYLEEDRKGFRGAHPVTAVIDANTFEITVSGIPSFPTGEVTAFKAVKSVQVYGAADVQAASEVYSKLKSAGIAKPTVFVIMLDADVSKDRHTLNDGIATFDRSNLGKLTVLQRFATTVFIPTENDTSGFKAQNLAFTEIYRALTSVMYGFRFDDPDSAQDYACINESHGPGEYDRAIYTHVYDWQVPSVITFENGADLQVDVAFRDIFSTWGVKPNDMAEMTLNIDLDDQPLT